MSNSKTEQLYPYSHENTQQYQGLTKFATLSPYLAQIQKRKKARSVLRQNRSKSKNQSSSKSFRIKQKSTSSLQSQKKKQLNNKTIASIINKINARKKQQSSRSKQLIVSKQKPQTPAYSLTIKYNDTQTINKPNDADKKEQKKKKQMSFRRNKYQAKSRNDQIIDNNPSKQTIQVSKYGYTDTNRIQKIKQEQAVEPKSTQNMYAAPGRKKFRRGKYEVLYSSVNSNDIAQEKNHPTKSQNMLQLNKKQSNLSINKDVDIMAQIQMQKYYNHTRSKEIRRSLQKSTQKYFKQDRTYRAPKTSNDIQIYVSTVKNPSVNRQSNASTLHTSKQQGSLYVSSFQKQAERNYCYDFDFKQPQQNFSGITQMQNPSEEESLNIQQQNSFEKQRKQVEKQYFHKKSPQIDWSQQDCQIDEA